MYKKSQLRPFDVNKIPGQPKRRKKITLAFNEEKRRDFLGGFHQRKLERKRKAQEELQQRLKEEKKKIKQEVRERYKKLASYRNVPELEELLSQQEYDMETHTVSILNLNIANLKEAGNWIGQNNIKEEKEEQKNDENDSNDSNDSIVGISLQEKKLSIDEKSEIDNRDIKSLKDVRREMKRVALKQMKKSKVFQQKQKIEQQKNKKKSKEKSQKTHEPIHGKKHKKNHNNRKIKKKSH